MFRKPGHLSQQELVLFFDGEVSAVRAYQVRRHLLSCSACRSREQHLENTIAELLRVHHTDLGSQVVDTTGLRASLKAQLRAIAQTSPEPGFRRYAILTAAQTQVSICLVLLVVAVSIAMLHYQKRIAGLMHDSAVLKADALPNGKLNPGATRPIAMADICPAQNDDRDPEVPSSTQRTVFQEYGMNITQASKYQIDYLISPQLGGTNDIRNLWPQPYTSTVWNAHVKDALEDRLHEMVCKKEIDLTSAQNDIATDWISAYQKYFHTSKPLEDSLASLAENVKF